MDQAGRGGSAGAVTTYSVHGLVTIRLENAPVHVFDNLVRQFGSSHGPVSDSPDITVTFVEKITGIGQLRYLDRNRAAFDDEHFYLLDTAGRRTRVDFTRLGEPSRLICEMDVSGIPLLVPIVGLHLVRKGHVLLHASSFVFDGKGVLVTGWKKGGKTEMLLPFMAAGAHYLAAEWTIVGGSGSRMYGLAGVIPLRNWHLRWLPQFWARLGVQQRWQLRVFRAYLRVYHALPGAQSGRSLPFRVLRQISREDDGLARLGLIINRPETLFPSHVWEGSAPLDRVFLGVAAQGTITVSPVEPAAIVARMIHSLAYERADLLAAYQQFQFAFPRRSNALLASVCERERELLSMALSGKPAHEIRHPYPVSLPDLYRAAVPFCR